MRAAFATPVSKPGSLPPPFVAPGESCVTARSFSVTPRALPIPDVPGIAYLAPEWPPWFGRLACPARYDRGMAYDEDLAARIRDLIGPDPELTEKKMFGGLAFLIRGHMAISASGQGGVLVR